MRTITFAEQMLCSALALNPCICPCCIHPSCTSASLTDGYICPSCFQLTCAYDCSSCVPQFIHPASLHSPGTVPSSPNQPLCHPFFPTVLHHPCMDGISSPRFRCLPFHPFSTLNHQGIYHPSDLDLGLPSTNC